MKDKKPNRSRAGARRGRGPSAGARPQREAGQGFGRGERGRDARRQRPAARGRGGAPQRPETETPKLHKVLAQAGLGSRLSMEQAIVEGRVSVNGKLAHVGQRVAAGDRIRVDGKLVPWRAAQRRMRVLIYHKPAGELVTRSDPQNRATVFERMPLLKHGKWQAVGRLDLNTEGLLLLTDSGWLANRLMHPRFGLEREYAVRVLGGLDAQQQRQLLDGVTLDDGDARFSALHEATAGDGVNRWYRATIAEGRNREVRRMIEAVGCTVSRLIRVRYGPVELPRSLRRGRWLELDEQRLADLMGHLGPSEPAPEPDSQVLRPAPRPARGTAARPAQGARSAAGRGRSRGSAREGRATKRAAR